MPKKVSPRTSANKGAPAKVLHKKLALLELMRLGNCIMAMVAVAIGFLLAQGQAPVLLAGAMISAFLICGAGQAINDIFDAKIDAKLSRSKPIPSGRVSEKEALVFACGLFFIGILLASFISAETFLIAVLFSFLLVLYSGLLGKVKYIGNCAVALGTSFTFIFGASAGAVGGEIPLLVITLAMSAFLANMAREITKDFEDLKKDRGSKKSLPMVDERVAKRLVLFYYALAIVLAVLAFLAFKLNLLYLIFVLTSAIVFALAAKQLLRGDYSQSHKNSKKGMLISLLGYIAAIMR